jgi:tungstate transport system permease protein
MLATLLDALGLLRTFDAQVVGIVWLSIRVSTAAVVIGTLLGMPIGAWLAVSSFRGWAALTVLLNGMMGLPSVVVGILVYLAFSRSGPLGGLGLLFTPTAMTIAQSILVIPLIAALTRQQVEDAWSGYAMELRALGFSKLQSITTLLYDCRFSLVVVILAGLGRAMSEVGAVMIVGGNIAGFTRVMTSAIVLETSKGDLPLSIALGLVLITVILSLNGVAYGLRQWAMRRYG